MDFAVPADYRVKADECKTMGYARELKNWQNMKVMVILMIDDVFGTVLKNMDKKLDELEI